MNLSATTNTFKKISTDILAVFVFHDKKLFSHTLASIKENIEITGFGPASQKDFSAKEGEHHLLYSDNKNIPRVVLIGLGDVKSFSVEKLRRASATASKKANGLKAKSLSIDCTSVLDSFKLQPEAIATAIAEGSLLSLYAYDKYLTHKKTRTLKNISLVALHSRDVSEVNKGLQYGKLLANATNHARDLENAPGSEIYPETLAKNAQRTGRDHGFSVTIFNKSKIRSLNMGGVLAVSKGSVHDPRFIVMEHGRSHKKNGTIVLVGKGVTFDTGGISIKPSANMAEMKMDMSGAAAVIGTMQAAAQLKLKKHLIGLVPAVENMPSGSAVKPGDIIRHYNGKTSEVDNTDAEGRLILADALSYADKFKPSVVIDLATLTGAVVVALGHYATGMMGNDQDVMNALRNAGENTYERVWQLPMFDEYEKQIKSDVADVKNVGGRWAGAITAAWFLKKFIGEYRWVHLDIAGTAILESDQDYSPRGGSGVGVRLLTEFLQQWK